MASGSAASGWPVTLVLSSLLDLGQALNVVDVGVRGDQRLAVRQRKIELADQLDDLVDRFLEADVDQQPLVPVEDQIDVAAQALPGLVVHFDDVGKDRLPRVTCCRNPSKMFLADLGVAILEGSAWAASDRLES